MAEKKKEEIKEEVVEEVKEEIVAEEAKPADELNLRDVGARYIVNGVLVDAEGKEIKE